MERHTEVQTWYVCFDISHAFSWWTIFLHHKFQHIILFKESASGGTIMLNPMSQLLAIKEYDNSIVNIINQEATQGTTAILQYTVYAGAHYRDWIVEPLTCVSVAKKVLGFRRRLITPYGLYKELLRAGAIAIKPY